MKHLRHWREKFDPNMDYVFIKSISEFKVGDVAPRDMKINKKRVLWRTRYLTRSDFYQPEVMYTDAPQSRKKVKRKVKRKR